MDAISKLVADALGQARLVGKSLDDKVIPILEPRHRAFASYISRRIANRDVISEKFLLDIDALGMILAKEARKGQSTIWRGHEFDPNCGYTYVVETKDAICCRLVSGQIFDLAARVQTALDAAKACIIANNLFDT